MTPAVTENTCMKMGHPRLFVVVCLFITLFVSHSTEALSQEGASLLAFKAAVTDPRAILADWNPSDASPCNWTGIWCDARSKNVLSINLAGSSLSGIIAPDLGSLKKLHRLSLQYNDFHGGIPQDLTNCTKMRALNLHHNNLSGNIPPQLGSCGFLQALYLQNNRLSGSIPMSFGNLQFLITMDLSHNFLIGVIPSMIGNLSSLTYLNLSYNQLDGAIPTNGVFSKFGASSFVGNVLLCGSLDFPACQHAPTQPYSPVMGPAAPIFSSYPTGSSHKLNAVTIAAICVGAFLFFKGICILLLLRKWSRSSEQREINLGTGGKLVMFQGRTSVSQSRKLLRCIGKLGQKDIIGEGGYGVVYKLTVKKHVFAIKKLKHCLESIRGFEAELETLGAIKHRNLAKLLGYCSSSTVKLLIYEYLANGTLEHLLHSRTSDQKPLDWPTRHRIALGVARGLAYLHHDCDPRIIHRDVSTPNILLDADLQPHLTDFGLARIVGFYDTHVTTTVAGTFGYIAPEYAEGGKATDKGDVYSFGVVLLEILTGRRPMASSEGEDINLAAWVRRLQEMGQEPDGIDPFLQATAPKLEIQTALFVACACISKNPENRPSMKKVVECLERDDLYLSHDAKVTIERADVAAP